MVYALYKKRRHFLQEAGRLTDPHEVESLNRYIRSLRTHLVIYFLFTPVTIWGLLLVLRILLPDDGEQPAIPASAPYFLVMLLIAVVLVAAKRSYRSNQKKLGTALAVDNRPPVLFLRSFRMDKQKKENRVAFEHFKILVQERHGIDLGSFQPKRPRIFFDAVGKAYSTDDYFDVPAFRKAYYSGSLNV